ncbi:PH domain-containing protein [Thermobifida alba]|uniref:PH domain-containing protein n=1 Tax=Thermobifida alba TaxID=53522 RepID=A0ABY4KZG4_THEAE|nr:PH domain-containing protein [Thermobifida alba]UPT20833.1 PH domain-containing protein [Thermobifida alba]
MNTGPMRRSSGRPPTEQAVRDTAGEPAPPVTESSAPIETGTAVPWRRLDARMILVDAVKLVVSLSPVAAALLLFDVEPTLAATWPVLIVAAFGLYSALSDVLRWITTRYRITDDYVERRTGLFVRKYRSIQRDRIRSVEAEARLRHRLARLRMVRIGAGQQNTAGESALVLDAVSYRTALELRAELLQRSIEDVARGREPGERLIQPIRYSWVIFNMFNGYAYVLAVGILWGAYWLLSTFGVDPLPLVKRVVDWEAIGWGWTALIAVLITGALGVVGLTYQFFNENWEFRLMRVHGKDGTLLRTTQGLFRTREVDREEHRIRGAEISEPLLWRWMGMADTDVITTGLSMWSMAPTILPRGPVKVAHRVVDEVLREERSPLRTRFAPHPPAALRRRLFWATLVSAAIVVTTAWALTNLGWQDAWPWWATALLTWPTALLLAVAGYRHLGHAIVGRYVVLRRGVMSRVTAAVQTRAVSGVTVRQSLLQQRLGLATVAVTTAAGRGKYSSPDLAVAEVGAFVDSASPGFVTPFLERKQFPEGWTTRERGTRLGRKPHGAVKTPASGAPARLS